MFPILNIGGLAIQVPGLVILVGIYLGLTLSEKYAVKFKVDSDKLYNLTFVALLAGIIGARLSYVLQFPSAFIENPGSLFSLNPGLLDLFGGSAVAGIAAIIYGQRKGLAFWPTLDALVPLFGATMIAIGGSNLASGSGFGMETDLPWAIELWGAARHPTQIYEMAAGVLILAYFWPGRIDPREPSEKGMPPGTYFLAFVGTTALARLLLEGFHGDSLLILNGVRSIQVAAWFVGGAAFSGWIHLSRIGKSQGTPANSPPAYPARQNNQRQVPRNMKRK